MTNIFCPRCQMRFSTTMTVGEIDCPYCGFGFNVVEPEGRGERRTTIERACGLSKGDVSLPARTVNISRSGICVTLAGPAQIVEDDRVRVTVKDFDLDTYASVVWVRSVDRGTRNAGLSFG